MGNSEGRRFAVKTFLVTDNGPVNVFDVNGDADQDVGDQLAVDSPSDQLATAPLLAPVTVDQPGADVLLHQPIPPTVDQQPPEPPDQDQGQLRRSERVSKKKFASLNLDNF